MRKEEDGSLGGESHSEESGVKRSSRNLNEKKRRDRFNILVQELAEIVSPENERKQDKLTVLKHAINFLQNHQSHLRSARQRANRQTTASWQPSFTTNAEFNLLMQEALDAFVIAIKSNGNIVYASHSVLPLLGYLPDEIQGKSLFSYMQENDAVRIWSQLDTHNSEKTAVIADKNSFQFRMKCGNFYTRNVYQVIDCKATVVRESNSELGEQNCNVIVIVGRVVSPQPNRIVITSDCQYKQFSYRLTMDCKYVYVDHRASSIIGFLPFEVLGTSFYEYCSPEELINIAQYHKILIRLGKVTTCYYRHLTKGQSWVWLRSSCYISYNQWNSKPESIICTASVVNFDEVCANQGKTIQQDREHFNRIISRDGNDSVSPICIWPSSPICAPDEAMEQDDFQQRNVDEATAYEQKEGSKTILTPHFLHCLMQTPSDQIMEVLDSHSDVKMASDEDESNELAWLENIKIPTGLTSLQLTTHLKLLEEYRKIAEQIRKQEKQLKMIKKLIEWSNLLLEIGSNFGMAQESSIDSEASSSVGS